MRRITFARNSKNILGLVLTVFGLAPIIVVLSNAWISGVSFLDLSALYSFLWENSFFIGSGIGIEVIYIVMAGIVTTIFGLYMLARKTERIEEVTVITEDLPVTLECTVCKHRWNERFSKTQLKSMGFPQNRTVSRRKCRSCGRFTRPKIMGM